MEKIKMGKIIELYKKDHTDGNLSTELVEMISGWDVYVNRYTENGSNIIELYFEQPDENNVG